MQDTNGDFNFLKSGLHKWAGDAYEFNKKEPYIELVTSPNNPNGFTRHDVVKGDKGILIDDLAFYQPQYTLILSLVEYDIMILSLQSRGNVFDVRLICLSPIEHLEWVIKSKLLGIVSMINKCIKEMEAELDRLGRLIVVDARAQLYTILELFHAFDKIFKEHLDGG